MASPLSKREDLILSKYAVRSADSKGRKYHEELSDQRLCFQRDKDRIIHCKAFRRLDEKTQVFMAGSGDHYRTRLTHTLEVAQIGRDIARRLGLNEDLSEAIALAHDLGHPPFGHAGEEALNEMMEKFDMHFEHNEQSRRVVEDLEKAYPDFNGLNLSIEVIEGMVKHQTAFDQSGKIFEIFPHLEAQVVNIADEIAYINHDMDDGLRSGLIKVDELKNFVLWRNAAEIVGGKYGKIKDENIFISRVISTMMAMMIDDFCNETLGNLKKHRIKTLEDVKQHRGVLCAFSDNVRKLVTELRKFLYGNFYMHSAIESFTLRGRKMIKMMFEYYYKFPELFPKNYL